MKNIIIYSFLTILFTNCEGFNNSKARLSYIDDFKWTLEIPENFSRVSKDKWNEIVEVGKLGVEKSFDTEIVNEATTIFIYKNGEFNTYESNYQPFNIETDGDYIESNNFVNIIMYQTFESQIPNAKMDSISSTQNIDGLEFHRFDININFPNGTIMKTIGFSRLFEKKELTINITYIDEKIGKKMMKSFENSKFE